MRGAINLSLFLETDYLHLKNGYKDEEACL